MTLRHPLVIALIVVILIIGEVRCNRIMELESTYQTSTLSLGPIGNEVMQVVTFRTTFDRDLYYKKFRIQDLGMNPDNGMTSSNPFTAYPNVPRSMVQQSGVARLECDCTDCGNINKRLFPQCENGRCVYESFDSSDSQVPPRFLMAMPGVEDSTSVMFSLFVEDKYTESQFKQVDKTFTAALVVMSRDYDTTEWKRYIPEKLDFSKCHFEFYNARRSPTKRGLTFISFGGFEPLGGFKTKTFKKRLPTCDYSKMTSVMHRVEDAYNSILNDKDTEDSMDIAELLMDITYLRSSPSWINCHDHMRGITKTKKFAPMLSDGQYCEYSFGTQEWLEHPCCNIDLGGCKKHKIAQSLDIPIELKTDLLQKFGENGTHKEHLLLALSKSITRINECVTDPESLDFSNEGYGNDTSALLMADILRCQYSAMTENFRLVSCILSGHELVDCFSDETLWPLVNKIDLQHGDTAYSRDCSITLITEYDTTLEQYALSVDPKTFSHAMRLINQKDYHNTGDMQVVPEKLSIPQPAFDSVYTSYLMRNSQGDYKLSSSPDFGGVSLEEKNRIISAIEAHSPFKDIDRYATVVNRKSSVVGQVVGTPVMIKTTRGKADGIVCVNTYLEVPIDKWSYPTPDFGVFDNSVDTFVPMGLSVLNVKGNGTQLCASVSFDTKGIVIAPVFRYKQWDDVDLCIYDSCMVCNGDNSTCSGCDGIPYSGKTIDQCGVCGGDNSQCTDCKGVINGLSKEDRCGVCDGDGSTCICCPGMTNPPFCDVEDKCYNVVCLNGGTCANTTGVCSCVLGYTGKNCEISDCNYNGFFSPKTSRCLCDRGWGGVDCSTCAPPKNHTNKFICIPNGAKEEYILTELPSIVADALVSGKSNDSISTEYQILFNVFESVEKRWRTKSIWPGHSSRDGYIRDCECKKTPIGNKGRELNDNEELKKTIPISPHSKKKLPVMFTKSELYSMSSMNHLDDHSKDTIRRRNRDFGLTHPRDVEPKPYDYISERCLAVMETRSEEVDAFEHFFRLLAEPRNVQSSSSGDCTNVTKKEEYGPAFWTLVGWSIFITLVVIVTYAAIILYIFQMPVKGMIKRKVDTFTLMSGDKMRRSGKSKRSRKRRKGN